MQLHLSVDPCTVCAPFVPSSLGVLFLQPHPLQSTISLSTKSHINIHFSYANFLLFIDQIIFKIYFFHLLVRTILTNIVISNSNYIIYMYMSIAISCGVDICTSPQSVFQYNYISIFIILIQFSSFIYQLQIFQESISFVASRF